MIYNTEYDRQFEVVISRGLFGRLVEKYGLPDALKTMVQHYYKPQVKRLSTPKRRKAFRKFIDLIVEREDIGVRVGRSKRELLNRSFQRRGLQLKVLPRGEIRVIKASRQRRT